MKVMKFWRRLRRAYRAEFGPAQKQWVRLTMPYPEIGPDAPPLPDKALSMWVQVSYSASGVTPTGLTDGMQVEFTGRGTPFVSNARHPEDGLWGATTHVEVNPAFENDTKGWSTPAAPDRGEA